LKDGGRHRQRAGQDDQVRFRNRRQVGARATHRAHSPSQLCCLLAPGHADDLDFGQRLAQGEAERPADQAQAHDGYTLHGLIIRCMEPFGPQRV